MSGITEESVEYSKLKQKHATVNVRLRLAQTQNKHAPSSRSTCLTLEIIHDKNTAVTSP